MATAKVLWTRKYKGRYVTQVGAGAELVSYGNRRSPTWLIEVGGAHFGAARTLQRAQRTAAEELRRRALTPTAALLTVPAPPERVEAHGEICVTDPCQACELGALRNKAAILSALVSKRDRQIAKLVEALRIVWEQYGERMEGTVSGDTVEEAIKEATR